MILAKHLDIDRTDAAALIIKFYGSNALTPEIEDAIASAIPPAGFTSQAD